MQNNAGYAYEIAINTEKTYKYALKMHKNCGHVSAFKARGVRGGTTENQIVSDESPRGNFYRKRLLFSFKKRNKHSGYGTGVAGNKVKYDGGHTTVNVWI